ncbi:MAG: Protein acetyltransferase [Chloroflexi bacterium]|jgi:GNAT superfamily N-acetyltransferase|nr:Protein acetyltransferase [Chloroflexota bacterium]
MTQLLTRLRDGTLVVIRPLDPTDREAYLALFDGIGAESRYRRFLGPKRQLTAAEIQYFTEVDHHDHEALVAIDVSFGTGLGVARFVRDRADPGLADGAITVVDAAQGRGVGAALLARLAERAREEGVDRLTADVLQDNRRMVAMLVHRGARPVPGGWAGVRHFELPLDA